MNYFNALSSKDRLQYYEMVLVHVATVEQLFPKEKVNLTLS